MFLTLHGLGRSILLSGREGDLRQCCARDAFDHGIAIEVDEIDGRIAFSSDGKRVAYAGRNDRTGDVRRRDTECFAVVDGKPGPAYYWVGNLEFSPDGEHIAYRAIKGNKSVMVVDYKEGPEYDFIDTGRTPIFSPKGNRTAYLVQRRDKNKWFVVVDGQESSEYDQVLNFKFSPNVRNL